LKAKHAGNIVAAWSLNPPGIIEANELYTTSLEERLKAAQKCMEAGYKLAFHFDPIIHFPGWEKKYTQVLESLFAKIRPAAIAWISLGTLRFNPTLKPIIENRFPDNKILDGELLKGYDLKLRYPYSIRLKIYETMLRLLKQHQATLPIYLCMEDKRMWKQLGLEIPFK
jgi:spore photoproduct lyase